MYSRSTKKEKKKKKQTYRVYSYTRKYPWKQFKSPYSEEFQGNKSFLYILAEEKNWSNLLKFNIMPLSQHF